MAAREEKMEMAFAEYVKICDLACVEYEKICDSATDDEV